MNNEQPLVELEGVERRFHTDAIETRALVDVFLDVQQGSFLAITGPSGCGKSTLLSVLGLLCDSTMGSYRLNGELVSDLTGDQRAAIRNREIGFIFQAFNLIADLTVEENVVLPLTYQQMTRKQRRKRAQDALGRVGMEHRRNHYPGQLSGGQQQRVAIARALVIQPSLILADEPTGNLDSKSSANVLSLLMELNRAGTTLCMVTHDPQQANLAGRSIELFDGRIVDEKWAS